MIGSTDVTIRRNRVSLIAMAAGIIVARQFSYGTPGAGKVVIEDNWIGDVQQNILPARVWAQDGPWRHRNQLGRRHSGTGDRWSHNRPQRYRWISL